jgi:transcriptional regulator GlxA family with amidase domain
LSLSFALRREAVASLLLELADLNPGRDAPATMAVSDLGADLLDPIVRLVRLLERPFDIAALTPAVEREILWRLLNGPQSALVRQIGIADSRTALMARAIEWVRHHYAKPMHISALADIAGMSRTSFHRHFRAVTAMTPLQFQKQIRLQVARGRLLSSAQDVATVGFSVGYNSPSQFGREYRRLFGRSPGQDAKSMRNPADTN